MMGADFFFRDKIPVAIIGAAGFWAESLIHHLAHHPWFKIETLCDDQLAGATLAGIKISSLEMPLNCPLIFSTLENLAYVPKERQFFISFFKSNSSPLILAGLIDPDGKTGILTIPQSGTIGIYLALQALKDYFSIYKVHCFFPEQSEEILEELRSLFKHDFLLTGTSGEGKEVEVQLELKEKLTSEQLFRCWKEFDTSRLKKEIELQPVKDFTYPRFTLKISPSIRIEAGILGAEQLVRQGKIFW